ncbi:MAG: hypothetical protein ACOC0N_05765 [Chroococcales cyanobacterium]
MNKKTQQTQTQFLTRFTLSLSLGATLGLLSYFAHSPAFAQSANSDGYQENEQGAFSSGNGFNPLQLINNAMLGGGRSMEEFNQGINQNLNNASNDFRRQQLEMIRQRQQGTASTDAGNESSLPEE